MASLQSKLETLRTKYLALFHAEARNLLDEYFAGGLSLSDPKPKVPADVPRKPAAVKAPKKRTRRSPEERTEAVESALTEIVQLLEQQAEPVFTTRIDELLPHLNADMLSAAKKLGVASDQLVQVGKRGRFVKYVLPSAGQAKGWVKSKSPKKKASK